MLLVGVFELGCVESLIVRSEEGEEDGGNDREAERDGESGIDGCRLELASRHEGQYDTQGVKQGPYVSSCVYGTSVTLT